MFSSDDIKKLSKLAHLHVNPEDEAQLCKKLGAIIEYVGQLMEVDVSGIEPMSHVHGSQNIFRADEAQGQLPIEALMSWERWP